MDRRARNPTHGQSAAELKRQIEAERGGRPFLIHRDRERVQHLQILVQDRRMTIGRDAGNDLVLDNEQVSRVHAELEPVGGAWVLSDQGLSTNGTYLNGERITGKSRLEDRDLIEIGDTGLLFRSVGGAGAAAGTVAADPTRQAMELTDSQRRVLVALCRPYGEGESFATPATNRTIAEEVHLSVDGVKGHLRVLFDRFGLSELPQNEKRARLAEQSMRTGAVKPSDLR